MDGLVWATAFYHDATMTPCRFLSLPVLLAHWIFYGYGVFKLLRRLNCAFTLCDPTEHKGCA